MQQTETLTFIIIVNIIFLIFIVGIILFIIQFKKRKQEHENEKSMITEQHIQEILSTQLEMQTQTMQHIGREIHDNVGQKLTLASLYTQQLAYENKAPHINDKIENIGVIINESLAELRQLSKSLTDDNINENNLNVLLQQECDKINNLKKCVVLFQNNFRNEELSYQIKSILLRITQEFLQNSIKHANCTKINIELANDANTLLLFLKDDGDGFDETKLGKKGIGLLNMKKRAEIIGGNFILDSKKNQGTSLTIQINL